jgi:hypothetical protein
MEGLLDDNLGNRAPIRNLLIERIEYILLIGYGLYVVWVSCRIIFYINASDEDLSISLSTFFFFQEGIVMAMVLWWRQITIRYDYSTRQQGLKKPKVLQLLRWIGGLVSSYSAGSTAMGMLSVLLSGSNFTFSFISYLILTLGVFGLDVLVLRYLYITNKIEKAIH